MAFSIGSWDLHLACSPRGHVTCFGDQRWTVKEHAWNSPSLVHGITVNYPVCEPQGVTYTHLSPHKRASWHHLSDRFVGSWAQNCIAIYVPHTKEENWDNMLTEFEGPYIRGYPSHTLQLSGDAWNIDGLFETRSRYMCTVLYIILCYIMSYHIMSHYIYIYIMSCYHVRLFRIILHHIY